MLTTPAVIPVTTPALTVARPVLPLVHTPPDGLLLNVVVLLVHTDNVPLIVLGRPVTVTFVERIQPVGRVYVIDATPPLIPLTVPPLTVAILLLLLVHEPPDGDVLSTVLAPSQILKLLEVIVPGFEFTVTTVDTPQPPPNV
jgi:hypothetical protein